VTDYLPMPTALLGERLRSALPGYRVVLAPHPAVGSPSARAVVVEISDPHLELVVWVRRGEPDEEPWSDRVVEVRVLLNAAHDEGDDDPALAAMVGDSVGFDDDPPVDEVLETVRVLLFEELPVEIADLEPHVQRALLQARRVPSNDPIARARS
jgi:hypothetical protein